MIYEKQKNSTKSIMTALGCALGIVALAAGVLLFSDIFFKKGGVASGRSGLDIIPLEASARTLVITTGTGGDFPAKLTDSADQQNMLSDMVAFAANYGYNHIQFHAVSDETAYYNSRILDPAQEDFDPLEFLISEAAKKNISVTAAISPFTFSVNAPAAMELLQKTPAWQGSNTALRFSEEKVRSRGLDVIAEITQRYGVAGVVLTGMENAYFGTLEDYHTLLLSFLEQAQQRLSQPAAQRLGIRLDSSAIEGTSIAKAFTTALQNRWLGYIMPQWSSDTAYTTSQLQEQLALWDALCSQNEALCTPLFSLSDHGALVEQAQTVYAGSLGVIGYHQLDVQPPVLAATLKAGAGSGTYAASTPDLNAYPKTFAITRPAENTVLDNSWDAYFISGTSVPEEPILLDGESVNAVDETGLWGHLVTLEEGQNTFTFQQGSQTAEIVITRQKKGGAAPIKTFRSGSLTPKTSDLVLYGNTLPLSCTAPYGASVTASIGGLTATLKAVESAETGTAVTYQGSLEVSTLTSAEQVKNLGQVTYALSFQGNHSTDQSSGTVFAAGKNATPVGSINSFGGMVNRNAANDGDYLTILRDGCVDEITSVTGNYYGLSNGGYIVKDAVDILEGTPVLENQVSALQLVKTDKGEKLQITGSRRPAYVGEWSGNTLTFTVFNTTGWDALDFQAPASDLWTELQTASNPDGSFTITLVFPAEDTLWGWDVEFTENTMGLYLKRPPVVNWYSETPLSGIHVGIDPGHGGADIGAQGVPSDSGPAENLFNLANAYILKGQLEALGATATILQEDTDSSLNNRLMLAQQLDTDFFVSIHHNSVSAIYDSNTVAGVEVYYWNDQSAGFANAIAQALTERTGQKLRTVEQTFYRVTMMNACPAVLVESGFLCNPAEYSMLAQPDTHVRYAYALTTAILQSLPSAAAPSAD